MRCHLGATPWLIDTSIEGSFSVAIPELSRVQPSSAKFWVPSPAESRVSPCSPRVSTHCFRESPNSRGQMALGGSFPGTGPGTAEPSGVSPPEAVDSYLIEQPLVDHELRRRADQARLLILRQVVGGYRWSGGSRGSPDGVLSHAGYLTQERVRSATVPATVRTRRARGIVSPGTPRAASTSSAT